MGTGHIDSESLAYFAKVFGQFARPDFESVCVSITLSFVYFRRSVPRDKLCQLLHIFRFRFRCHSLANKRAFIVDYLVELISLLTIVTTYV